MPCRGNKIFRIKLFWIVPGQEAHTKHDILVPFIGFRRYIHNQYHSEIKKSISIPVNVKLSADYTNTLNFIYRKSLRYEGWLFDNIKADICSSHGIFTGADLIKMLLSGATCIQVLSALYKNGLMQIQNIQNELVEWIDLKTITALHRKYPIFPPEKGKENEIKNNIDHHSYKTEGLLFV